MTLASHPTLSPSGKIARRTLVAIAASVAMIAANIAFVGPSARADHTTGDGTVTSEEITTALQNIDGDLVEEAVASTPPAGGPAPTALTGAEMVKLEVDIATSATDGVSLSAGDFSLGIALPNAHDARAATTLADGSIAYPSDGESANAVVPTANGVQLLSIIEGRAAPENYTYDLSFPADHRLETTSDGGARIVDAEGAPKVEFEPAWAKDAGGQNVPTHYAVEGNTLTQVVEHKSMENVSYPIVADPVPVVVLVITAFAMVAVAAAVLGVATWIVLGWWNTCRAQNKWPELSTRNGFTARCVR